MMLKKILWWRTKRHTFEGYKKNSWILYYFSIAVIGHYNIHLGLKQTTQMYYLKVLELRGPKIKISARLSSEGFREKSTSLTFSVSRGHLHFLVCGLVIFKAVKSHVLSGSNLFLPLIKILVITLDPQIIQNNFLIWGFLI